MGLVNGSPELTDTAVRDLATQRAAGQTDLVAPAARTAAEALAAQRAGMRVNAQTGTSYTFALADTYELGTALNTFANPNPVAVIIPKNSAVPIPIGHRIECEATGAGKVTFAPVDGDVTLVPATTRSIAAVNKAVTLVQISANVWHAFGALIA